MILPDTSAWIEFDRATESDIDLRLNDLIAAGGPVATTEPVVAEVLMGARTDAREYGLRALLARFEPLPFDTTLDFNGAVAIYRRCRQIGVTPRGLVDCMVASVALRHRASLLAHDADVLRIAEVVGIPIDHG